MKFGPVRAHLVLRVTSLYLIGRVGRAVFVLCCTLLLRLLALLLGAGQPLDEEIDSVVCHVKAIQALLSRPGIEVILERDVGTLV